MNSLSAILLISLICLALGSLLYVLYAWNTIDHYKYVAEFQLQRTRKVEGENAQLKLQLAAKAQNWQRTAGPVPEAATSPRIRALYHSNFKAISDHISTRLMPVTPPPLPQ